MDKINAQTAKEVFHKKGKINKITIKDIIYKKYKREEDGKMPNKKDYSLNPKLSWLYF